METFWCIRVKIQMASFPTIVKICSEARLGEDVVFQMLLDNNSPLLIQSGRQMEIAG